MSNPRYVLVDCILGSSLPSEIIKLIYEYDEYLSGHIVNIFRFYNNDNIAPNNLKPLSNGFVCNQYQDPEFSYIANSNLNEIDIISTGLLNIDKMFTFPNDILIISTTDALEEAAHIIVYRKFKDKKNRENFVFSKNTLLTNCIQISENEYCFGYQNGNLEIWDLTDLTLLYTLTEHTSKILSLLLLPDFKLASGDEDGKLLIWDLTTKKHEIILDMMFPLHELYYIPENNQNVHHKICILANEMNQSISVCDYITKNIISKPLRDDYHLDSIGILNGGQIVYHDHSNLIICDPNTLDPIYKLKMDYGVRFIYILTDNRIMVKMETLNIYKFSQNEDKTIELILEHEYPLPDVLYDDQNKIIRLFNGSFLCQSNTAVSVHI